MYVLLKAENVTILNEQYGKLFYLWPLKRKLWPEAKYLENELDSI